MGARGTTPRKRLGDWDAGAPYVKDTVYQAPSDGFVVAQSNGNGNTVGYTDSFTPPTTLRQSNFGSPGTISSISLPVKKGEYWEVARLVGGTTTTIFWIPLEP